MLQCRHARMHCNAATSTSGGGWLGATCTASAVSARRQQQRSQHSGHCAAARPSCFPRGLHLSLTHLRSQLSLPAAWSLYHPVPVVPHTLCHGSHLLILFAIPGRWSGSSSSYLSGSSKYPTSAGARGAASGSRGATPPRAGSSGVAAGRGTGQAGSRGQSPNYARPWLAGEGGGPTMRAIW